MKLAVRMVSHITHWTDGTLYNIVHMDEPLRSQEDPTYLDYFQSFGRLLVGLP